MRPDFVALLDSIGGDVAHLDPASLPGMRSGLPRDKSPVEGVEALDAVVLIGVAGLEKRNSPATSR